MPKSAHRQSGGDICRAIAEQPVSSTLQSALLLQGYGEFYVDLFRERIDRLPLDSQLPAAWLIRWCALESAFWDESLGPAHMELARVTRLHSSWYALKRMDVLADHLAIPSDPCRSAVRRVRVLVQTTLENPEAGEYEEALDELLDLSAAIVTPRPPTPPAGRTRVSACPPR